MSKPREFWIVPDNDTVWIKSDFDPDKYSDQDYFKKENPIHVIEKSAYDALQSHNAELISALEKIEQGSGATVLRVNDKPVFVDQIARAVLSKIKKESET